jgi:hypothetical protein
LLLLSLGYNAIWISASPAILEMQCKVHLAEVSADAIAHKQREDWSTAAHLFAYLIRYYPQDRCTPTAEEANWKLPLGALALKWRYQESAEQTAETNELELKGLRRAYAEAIEHARLSTQPPAIASTGPSEIGR